MRIRRWALGGGFAWAILLAESLGACSSSGPGDGGSSATGTTSSHASSSGSSSSSGSTCSAGVGCTLGSGQAGACCQPNCVDTASDPENCGACGLTCPSDANCSAGACFVASCASGASPTLGCSLPDSGPGECCAGGCVDFKSAFNGDPLNCGSCGDACEITATCKQGSCTLASGVAGNCSVDADCPSSQNCTENGCQTSSCQQNNATPGVVCALGTTQGDTSGICCPVENQTPDGVILGCVDYLWGDQNCGGCGFTCGATQSCDAGHCI